MPIYDTRCTACGIIEPERTLPVGVHPLCSCGAVTEYFWVGRASARFTNEAFIGGITIENLGHEPVVVYSREEFQRAMDKDGVEQRIKYVPGDKFLSNWAAAIDPYTLEAARALVSRPGALGVTRPHLPALAVTTSVRTLPIAPQPSANDQLDDSSPL